MDMALAQATKSHETTYTLDDAMENGRVWRLEEAWKEIDADNFPKGIKRAECSDGYQ